MPFRYAVLKLSLRVVIKLEWMKRENDLLTRRNIALWQSLRNPGDEQLEAAFMESCKALIEKTRNKRNLIEQLSQ